MCHQLKQSPGRFESCDVSSWENKTPDVGAEAEGDIVLIAAVRALEFRALRYVFRSSSYLRSHG